MPKPLESMPPEVEAPAGHVAVPMRQILTNVDKSIAAQPVERTQPSPRPALFERQAQFEKRLAEHFVRFGSFADILLGPDEATSYNREGGGASLIDIQIDRFAAMEHQIERADARLDEIAARIGFKVK